MYRKLKIKNIINDIMTSALEEMFYNSFMKKNATRSSKRTDALHESIKTMLKQAIDPSIITKLGLKITTDINKKSTGLIDYMGKNISLDLKIEENGKIKEIFMIKAPMTSLNKNFNNSLNACHGEGVRILSPINNRDMKVHFINFIPNKAPKLKSDKEEISEFEDIQKFVKTENYLIEDFGVLGKNFNLVNVYYDLDSDYFNAKNIKDIHEMTEAKLKRGEPVLKITNIEELERVVGDIQERYGLEYA